MSVSFIVAVFDYSELVFFIQTEGKKIPETGEEIEIDFSKPTTVFIEGAWGGNEKTKSVYSFTIHEPNFSFEEYGGLPVVECQLAYTSDI